MSQNLKSRSELRSYFKAHLIPSEQNFADLIDAQLNMADDGIRTGQATPLDIQASGSEGGSRKSLSIYGNFSDPLPAWSMDIAPLELIGDKPETRKGLGFLDGSETTRLFLKQSQVGEIGVNTIEPEGQLHVGNKTSLKGPEYNANPNQLSLVLGRSGEGVGTLKMHGSKAGEMVYQRAANNAWYIDSDGGKYMLNFDPKVRNNQPGVLSIFNGSGKENIRLHSGSGDSYIKGSKLGLGIEAPKKRLHLYNKSDFSLRIESEHGSGDIGIPNNQYFSFQTTLPGFYLNRKLTVGGEIEAEAALKAGNSDLYFTKTDHAHTGFGNTKGYAAIENASNYNALMILGRQTDNGRRVRLWDYLQVNGTLDVTGNITERNDLLFGTEAGKRFIMHSRGNTKDFLQVAADKADGAWDWTNGITLSRNGNVGISDTSPGERLEVNGNIKATGELKAPFFRAGQGNSANVAAGKWYRIAQNTGSSKRANAEFTLRDYISGGGHSCLTFRLGASFNNTTGFSFTLINHNWYSKPTFTKIRLLRKSTYDAQYLEVYVNRAGNVDYSIYDNLQSDGWVPVDWSAGTLPSGYTAHEYNVDRLFSVGNHEEKFSVERDGGVKIKSNLIFADNSSQSTATDIQMGTVDIPRLNGVATSTKNITFGTAFKQNPKVIVAISKLDSDHGRNLRINTAISKISKTGFTLKVNSWSNTIIYGARISWIAVST